MIPDALPSSSADQPVDSPAELRTSNKRQFLATMLATTLAFGGGRAVAEESDDDDVKPVRSRKYPPKGKHPTLKEYFIELITKDAEIRKSFEAARKSISEEDSHLQEFDAKDVSLVKWFPYSTTWARPHASDIETYLAIAPVTYARGHYLWVNTAVIAKLRVVTSHSQEDLEKEDIPKGIRFEFLGFQKLTLEPIKA